MTRRDQAYRDQPSLFDAPTPPKLCRDCDPPTSHNGAEQFEPKRKHAVDAMFEAFTKYGPMSANEAAAWCVGRYGGLHDTYRKRYHELELHGRIELCGERPCRVTHMTVQVYRTYGTIKDVGRDGSKEDATGATDGTAMEGRA